MDPFDTRLPLTAADSGEGAILPTWTAVDNNNVKTSRELWEVMKRDGWNVDVGRIPFLYYHHLILIFLSITGLCSVEYSSGLDLISLSQRIPISPDRPIEVSFLSQLLAYLTSFQDNYLDAYLQIMKETDALGTAVIFSCGTGSVRTTFAMVAASIIRRTQLLARGMEDPYPMKVLSPTKIQNGTAHSGTTTVWLQFDRKKYQSLTCVF